MQLYEGRQLNKTNADYIEQRNARRLLGIVTDGQLFYYPSPFGTPTSTRTCVWSVPM